MKETFLTPSELRVLDQAARGLTNSESAKESFHAIETVKYHRTNIIRKLRARNITHAVALAYQHSLFLADGQTLCRM